MKIEIIKNIKNNILKNKIDNAVELLFEHQNLFNEDLIISISRRFEEVKANEIRGVISAQESSISKNNITNDILKLIRLSDKPFFHNIRFYNNQLEITNEEEIEYNNQFKSPISWIRVKWNLSNGRKGLKFIRKWYKNDELWIEKEDVIDDLWMNKPNLSTYIHLRNGFEKGTYYLRLFIENEFQASESFSII